MSLLLLTRRRLLSSHQDPLAFSFLKGISTGNFPRNFVSVIYNPCSFVPATHNGQVARLKNNGFKNVVRQDVFQHSFYRLECSNYLLSVNCTNYLLSAAYSNIALM